jgi:hypothetical protein
VTDSKDADFKHLLIFIRPQTYTKKMESVGTVCSLKNEAPRGVVLRGMVYKEF